MYLRARLALVLLVLTEFSLFVAFLATPHPSMATTLARGVATSPDLERLVIATAHGLGMALSAWLLSTTVMAIVAAARGSARPRVFRGPAPIERLIRAALRSAGRASIAAVLAMPVTTTSAHATRSAGGAAIETVVVRTNSTTAPTVATPPVERTVPTPYSTRTPPTTAPTTAPTSGNPPDERPQIREPVDPAQPVDRPGQPRVHTVRSGENLWSISTDVLRVAGVATPSNGEIARFWTAVIERNRTTLRSGDPNLIYPGELIEIPVPN